MRGKTLPGIAAAILIGLFAWSGVVLVNAPAAEAHRGCDSVTASAAADRAIKAYGDSGVSWSTVWTNAGFAYAEGLHSWKYYGAPGLGRYQWTVPVKYWLYNTIVRVEHCHTAFIVDVYNKRRGG